MSLSRKYRPQTFGDITDQISIKETLRKEIAANKLGHAYLFSGSRGVGKTTTARIFAKALNCLNQKDGEPCNQCAACHDFNDGRFLDFIEMDAATHTGVENVREAIVEHVRFSPTRGKYKIYVLDEAHMLSAQSWNALLKTLEEPPSYAIFILATTEFHKVPVTIVSRCQRFDFKKISSEILAERVKFLASAENVSLTESVVGSVVKHADGCVRDAETLLDQLLALGEKKITEEIASLVIPISRLPIATKILEICLNRTLGPVLKTISELENDGIPLLPIFDDLIHAVRELLIASSDQKRTDNLKTGDEGEKMLAALVGRFSAAELGEISLLLMERRRDAKQGIDARFALELAVTAIAEKMLPHSPGTEGQRLKLDENSSQSAEDKPKPPKKDSDPPSAPIANEPKPEVKQENSASVTPNTNSNHQSVLTLATVQRKWSTFSKAVGEKNASLTFILSTCRPVNISGSILTIKFQYAYHKDKIVGDLKNKRMLEDIMTAVLEVPEIHFEAVIGEDPAGTEKRSKDMVSNILRAFGGEVV